MDSPRLLRDAGYRRVDAALLCGLGLVGAVAVGMRAWGLDHLPGINGDEAWYGVQMLELRGGNAAWQTPRENLLNPFFSAPIFLMHLVFEPDFWILRVPAFLSGIALIPLTFFLVRRLTDEPTAVLATLLVAVLPVDIAYARIGWDPSQSTLVVLIALFCAARRRWFSLAASLLAAVIVHPTNVFALPVVASVALAASLGARERDSAVPWRPVVAIAAAALPVLAFVVFLSRGGAQAFSGISDRLGDAAAWAEFGVLSSRLFSGVTTYQYFAGDPSPGAILAHDVAFWSLCLPVVLLAVRRSTARRDWRSLSWLVGTAAALLAFFAVAGPHSLEPDRGRYALWLVVPATIAFAVSCRALISGPGAYRVAVGAGILVALLALGSFTAHYLAELVTTGGRAALTYRTARIEPKAQAFDWIAADARAGPRAPILAESWWLYWPLRYRAANVPGLSVVAMRREDYRSHLDRVLGEGGYAVGFVGGRIHRYVFWRFPDSLRQTTIADYGGDPLLGVWRLEPAP